MVFLTSNPTFFHSLLTAPQKSVFFTISPHRRASPSPHYWHLGLNNSLNGELSCTLCTSSSTPGLYAVDAKSALRILCPSFMTSKISPDIDKCPMGGKAVPSCEYRGHYGQNPGLHSIRGTSWERRPGMSLPLNPAPGMCLSPLHCKTKMILHLSRGADTKSKWN